MKRVLMYVAAIAALCLSSCKKELPFTVTVPESAELEQGVASTIEVALANAEVTPELSVVSSDSLYAVSVELAPKSIKKAIITITPPDYIFEDVDFSVVLTAKAGGKPQEQTIAMKAHAYKDLVVFSAAANCFPVRPSAQFIFPLANEAGKIAADTVVLAWQDAYDAEAGKGIVKYAQVIGDRVGVVLNDLAGNAVIKTVKGESSTWSYHIWVTKDDLLADNITFTGTDEKTYTITNVALGAMAKTGVEAAGCFYAWASKNPVPAAKMDGNDIKTIYDAEGKVTTIKTQKADAMEDNYTTALTEPMLYYTNSGGNANNYGWLLGWEKINKDTYYDYWGSKTGKKSVSDPCPAGYMMPTKAALGCFVGVKLERVYAGTGTTYDDLLGFNAITDSLKMNTFLPLTGDFSNTGALELCKGYTSNKNSRAFTLWTSTPDLTELTSAGYYRSVGMRTQFYKSTHDGNATSVPNPSLGNFTHAYGFMVRCMKIN